MKKANELKELRAKNVKVLQADLDNLNNKLNSLRFDKEFRKNKDVNAIKKTRQSIARSWTILREKFNEKQG